MIINYDIKPDRQLYSLGAKLIMALQVFTDNFVDLLDAFEVMKAEGPISMNAFFLTLDWLFLLGLINYDEGRIKKCF